MYTTKDLAKFNNSDLKQVEFLLKAMRETGLPAGFLNDEVQPMKNNESGWIFLTNSEYQVALINEHNKTDRLEIWHNCGNCGHEGFAEDCQLNDDGCNECNEVVNEE